ncbi:MULTISPECIES: AAA family ATPase [Sporomusaceae]|uniref:AAA family ATPase n=1 Tax=Sporomusaceae TaxID=1843490 RepID=UPI0003646464|nr:MULTISPECIES: AAA family ATPase [Sporomusaceae]
MNISITNCNNIDNGSINLLEGRLNIKYAINGTGKSTLAKAINFCNVPEQLKSLMPYKYLAENPVMEEHKPSVECFPEIQKVSIFNEESVNQYTFLPDDLLADSFEILIKTADYENRMRTIQLLIQEIQNAFRENPDLDRLIAELTTFISGFGNAQNGYSKTGSIGKGVAKGNKIANIPNSLREYTPYIQSEMNASWLTWQSKGAPYLDVAEKCPYCAERLKAEKKVIVQQVAVEYDSKYVAELQKMISVFQALQNYFTDSVRDTIERLSKSSIAFSQEEINFLKEIKTQVCILNNKLIEIKSLNFGTLKDVDAVIVALQGKRIDLAMLGHINSPYTIERISVVNNALENIITQAGQLQGEINQQKNLIRRTIEKYHKEINGFLESAGYNYQVSIKEDQEKNTYRMVLLSKENLAQVNDVKLRLSYGEKNAFALVLFMYRAIKEEPDLIVLDDPISSFDKNKKYAIMEMLFQGAGSLQGKTVMMLTHDFDPIVDLIHTSCIRCRFNPVPTASFLYNEEGCLREKNINSSDIRSFFEIAQMNIDSSIDEINKLIYLRRRLEACGDKGLAWQLLSNVFHPGRIAPVLQEAEGTRQMTVEEIAEATAMIIEEIPEFDYARVYQKAHDKTQMISLYKSVISGYEKIQLYRIINHGQISDTIFKKFVDEAYHIENDNLFQLNPTEYPTIPEYIIKLCDNGVALLEE